MKRHHHSIDSSYSSGEMASYDKQTANIGAKTRPLKKLRSSISKKTWKIFTTKEGAQNAKSDLCRICKTIDFRSAFNLQASEISADGDPIFVLDSKHVTGYRTRCSACKMFISMVKNGVSYEIDAKKDCHLWHLRVFRVTSLSNSPLGTRRMKGGITAFISLVASPPVVRLNVERRADCWKQGIILPTCLERPDEEVQPDVKCCALERNPYARGARIREMLEPCLTKHDCRPLAEKFPVDAHVIDCTVRMIVPLTKEKEYFALSYVWEKPSKTKSLDDDGFEKGHLDPRANIPVTIEDAITVVKTSGYRYLWVDRYCIQQHKSADKKHQIKQMANIYANAIATICALGVDGNAGIDGISQPRESQSIFKSQNMTLVKCFSPEFSLSHYLQDSPWITRGWTLQEPLLSTRCLFFTSEQVICVCQSGSEAETITMKSAWELEEPVRLNLAIFIPNFAWLTFWRTDDGRFNSFVQHYQKRSLTYDSDALDALRGILSVLHMRSYWGVPIARAFQSLERNYKQGATNIGFAFGLLWHLVEPLERISPNRSDREKKFPSWSWLSRSDGLVDFIDRLPTNTRDSLRYTLLSYWENNYTGSNFAKIQAEKSDGSAISIGNLFMNESCENIAPEYSPCIRITSSTTTWRLDTKALEYSTVGFSSPVVLSSIGDSMMEINAATIYFDQDFAPSSSICKEYHTLARKSSNQEGFAILIFHGKDPNTEWFFEDSCAYWLAVYRLQDGTYKRQGLIKRCLTDDDEKWMRSHKESYETIRLF